MLKKGPANSIQIFYYFFSLRQNWRFGDILASTFFARQYLLDMNCRSLFASEFICQWHFLPGFYLPGHNLPVIFLPGHYLPVFFLPGHYLLATFFAWIYLPVTFFARIFFARFCQIQGPTWGHEGLGRNERELSTSRVGLFVKSLWRWRY